MITIINRNVCALVPFSVFLICDLVFSYSSADIIDKLTLTFNRTRQAVITKELIEIISGAAAL